MKRREDGTIDFGADPAVQDELSRGRQRQAMQRMSPEKRSRAARQAEIDAQRNRRNIDIDPELERQVEMMADELGVPFSQLLSRLAYEGQKYLSVDSLVEERQPSRSMRFEFTLPLPGKTKKPRRYGTTK